MKRIKTKFTGVYEREALNRKNKNSLDTAYDICYRRDNKLIWEKVGWASEGYSPKLADQVRSERIRSMRHGLELPNEKPKTLFKDAVKKYLEWAKTNKAKGGRDDESLHDGHLSKRFDNTRMDQISSFDLEKMKSELLKKGYAPATVKHVLVLVRQIYNRAIAWGLYQGENPVKKVKMPTISNQRTRFLTFEEAEVLLHELKRNVRVKKEYRELEDPRLHDITLLSLHTGARASEIFNLKGHDVDFQNGLITLRDTKNTETRHIPMTEAVREMLKRRIPQEPSGYVFTDTKGAKIREVSNAFDRVVNRLGFNKNVDDSRRRVVFHTCRHTFASWLAIQGTPLYTIAKLMGHKSISMSERYSHLSPDHKKESIGRLEQSIIAGKERGKRETR